MKGTPEGYAHKCEGLFSPMEIKSVSGLEKGKWISPFS